MLLSRAADEPGIAPLAAKDAKVFRRPTGTAAIQIERLMADPSDQPIERRISYVTTQRFHYVVESR